MYDLKALFDAETPPPRDPAFVAKVMTEANRYRKVALGPAVVVMIALRSAGLVGAAVIGGFALDAVIRNGGPTAGWVVASAAASGVYMVLFRRGALRLGR